jgi:Abortive infection alpha
MAELNITSTAVEKGLDLVKGFVEKLVGGAIEEAGLMFTDKVRLRRLKNQIKILEKAQKIVKDANIDVKQINLKILVPLLENCSLEEEESLQELWANLIVNFSNSNKVYRSSVYPFILSQLTSQEARFPNIERSDDIVHIDANGKVAEVHNLVRLGLLEKFEVKVMFRDITAYRLTQIGKEFTECCSIST